MNTQHTKGPWTKTGSVIYYQANPGGRKFTVADVSGESGPAIQSANACLIAAAPELLEKLQDCADWLSRSTRIDDREMAADAHALIAKATGGTT